MRMIKFSSKVDAETWAAFRAYADAQHQSICGLLSEALAEYLRQRAVRPEALRCLEESLGQNAELGHRLGLRP